MTEKTYATFSATFIVKDIELLKKKYAETEWGQIAFAEIESGEHDFNSASAILDLLLERGRESEIGVEFYASSCEPDSEDGERNASNGTLVYRD